MSKHVKTAIAALLVFAIGFFAGREHLKYEVRSQLREAMGGLANAFGTGAAVTSESPRSLAAAAKPQNPDSSKEPPAMEAKLLEKEFMDLDIQRGIYESTIRVRLQFDNLTNDNIRAFEGRLKFIDLLGNQVSNVRVVINDSIPVGGSIKWDGGISYNPFMDDSQRLKSESIDNLKVTFEPSKILFVDGQVKEYQAKH